MIRRNVLLALATAAVAAAIPGTASAQGRPTYPNLRAALHELREAKGELRAARDAWPPGYKAQTERAIDDAIVSVRTLLDIKDVDNFRGVDRSPDFYKRYSNHPRLRAALQDLRDARAELLTARADAAHLRERAIDDVDVAVGYLVALLRSDRPGPRPGR